MIPGTKGKVLKGKKEAVEFGAENIDNTAPVKKILDELQHKNTQAFSFYCQTIRPRPAVKENYNFHYSLTGHPIHAFADDWEGDLSSLFFEPFPYQSFMPKILTPMNNIEKTDPVTEYIKLKNEWNRNSKSLRHTAVRKSLMDKYESLNEDVVRCPKYFVDIAVHLDSDPDPFFDDSYNWYYAGHGNMQLISIEWVDYLLHSELSYLYLTQFSKNELNMNTVHSAIFYCGDNNILETICSSHNIVALRTRCKVYILKIISFDDKIEFKQIKSTESEVPFTSISFDNYHKNILYITNLYNKLLIVNLDRLTARTVNLESKITSLVNNWNAVISSDRLMFTHVTRNSITMYDKRTNSSSCTWNSVRDVSDHLGCNDITVARHYNDSSVYYATDHHLFLLDIRIQKRRKPKAILRWTHGMQCAPTNMSFCDFEFNKELVCLCSQWCEDMCIVPNYNRSSIKEGDIASVTMPYRPPSILTTLQEAKEKLLCVDVNESIDSRLASSITGHKIIEQGENYVVLMQNSLGDISAHILYPEHMVSFLDDDSIQHLENWSKAYQKEKKPSEVSSVIDISNTWVNLKRIPEEYILNRHQLIRDNIKTIRKEISDTFDKEELDAGLLDGWRKESSVLEGSSANSEIAFNEGSSFAINLHYSDESLSGDGSN